MKSLYVRCAVLALFCISFSFSADDAAEILTKAQAYYKASKFDSTVNVVRAYLKTHGGDNSSQELVPLLMEALVRKGDFQFSLRLFQIYAKKFPASPFMPRLWYLEGVSLIKDKNYASALLAFTNSLNGGINNAVDSLIQSGVQRLCEKTLTGDELLSLSARTDFHQRIDESLKYYDMLKFFQTGMTKAARQKAGDFMEKYPHSQRSSLVKDIYDKSKSQQKGALLIGVLAPLSGNVADVGKQVVQGIQLAIDRFIVGSDLKIKLVICDTRGNMLETARQTQELINNHHVSVIIGPILSQNAIVAASMLVGKDIVMITPTATDDGIAALGPNIFQMNIPLGVLGAKIAKYAMDNLNIHDFAIISPSSEYGTALSKIFRAEVEKKGCEIVNEQTYDEGTHDFKGQLEKLREELKIRNKQRTLLEKSLEGEEQQEPKKEKRSDPKTDKKLVMPVDSTLQVGGLFIPAESEDVTMIAPQVTFHRIHAQLLGSTGWLTPKTILDGKEYVNNALFSTNIQPGADGDKEWTDFRSAYKARYNVEPERIAAMGFDAASLVLQVLRDNGTSNVSAAQLSQALAEVRNYKGASGPVTFDPAMRVNVEAGIMKIKDKQFIRVQ
jgi:ABC-type branched-subunit amino acid transport system substrate-binding protein